MAKTLFLMQKVQIFCFSGPNVHIWVQNYSFYPKFVHFSEIFWQNFVFSVKSTIFLFFLGPNVHFWVQNYTFYPKFVHFSEIFWQKRHL